MKNILCYLSCVYFCIVSQSLLASHSQLCKDKAADFSNELSRPVDANAPSDSSWGPEQKQFPLRAALKNCLTNINWEQQRILAAADYWVQRKLNYCHHHVPDWQTPHNLKSRKHNGGACSAAKNIAPNSPYFGERVRWNYTGNQDETPQSWQDNLMWYGMDCSNFTAYLYNFAFGTVFSSNTHYQAGERSGHSQLYLNPNQQSATNSLDNPHAAGSLVCSDNTLEVAHSCKGHGGYFSVYSPDGTKDTSRITASMLLALQPGDLLFIAPSKKASPVEVTHVVMWTGKKIGMGLSDIKPAQIAPNKTCGAFLKPQLGAWVIVDSHYQGPDYRELTACFYLNNVWGVRRVIFSNDYTPPIE
jgi:cell wall-associated NlpC family hydrolase